MPEPKQQTVSFYKYVSLTDPVALRARLFGELSELGCLGRIYLAGEGINAQMSVPREKWDKFDAVIKSIPEFADVPYKLAVEEGNQPSFHKLTIKVRPKIVADGLDDDSFDPGATGPYLTAREMNEYIADPEAVVVDMRNAYESEIGHFEGALRPEADTFREELRLVPKLLKVHKNKKLLSIAPAVFVVKKLVLGSGIKAFLTCATLRVGLSAINTRLNNPAYQTGLRAPILFLMAA